MGVPFDAVDRRQLVEFSPRKSSYGDASDIVSTWIGKFRGLRVGLGAKPIWRGLVPGSKTIDYGIIVNHSRTPGTVSASVWTTYSGAQRISQPVSSSRRTRVSTRHAAWNA